MIRSETIAIIVVLYVRRILFILCEAARARGIVGTGAQETDRRRRRCRRRTNRRLRASIGGKNLIVRRSLCATPYRLNRTPRKIV